MDQTNVSSDSGLHSTNSHVNSHDEDQGRGMSAVGGGSTMSAGALSHASPRRYDSMIGTVAGLQADLQRTLSVAQALRDENDKLRTNYEAIKGDLVRLKEKYAAQRNQLLEAVEAKLEADKGMEALVQKWKSLLESRTKELEALQSQLAPQDLDMLRAQVAEELEVPHKKKLEAVEAEAERQRQMFFSVRREYERCKAEYEQYTVDQAKEAESLREAHDTERHALRKKINELETAVAEASTTEDVRLLTRRVNELATTEDALRTEVTSMRASRDALELEMHRLRIQHQRELAASVASSTSLEADKQSLVRRVESLSADVTRLGGEADGQRARCEALSAEVATLRHKLADREDAANVATSNAIESVNRTNAGWTSERGELRQQIEALSHKAFLADRRAREIAERANERVRAAQEMEERANRDIDTYLHGTRGEIQSLEAEIERLSIVAQQSEQSATAQMHRMRREIAQQKSDLERIQREKSATLERMAQDRAEYEKLKHNLEASMKAGAEANEAQRFAEARLADAQASIQQLTSESDAVRSTLSELERDYADLIADAERLRASHLAAIKELKEVAAKDRKILEDRMTTEMAAIKTKARRSNRKANKRAEAYKKLAISLHKEGQQLRKGAIHAKKTAISASDVAGLTTALARMRAKRSESSHPFEGVSPPLSPVRQDGASELPRMPSDQPQGAE